jgi:hypothetical protein
VVADEDDVAAGRVQNARDIELPASRTRVTRSRVVTFRHGRDVLLEEYVNVLS